jgi:hypothetical protein
MKKHPYYDSKRKQRTESIAMKTMAWTSALILILAATLSIIN